MQLVERKQLALHDRAFNFVPQLRRVPNPDYASSVSFE
jgi:hypothetical protein